MSLRVIIADIMCMITLEICQEYIRFYSVNKFLYDQALNASWGTLKAALLLYKILSKDIV